MGRSPTVDRTTEQTVRNTPDLPHTAGGATRKASGRQTETTDLAGGYSPHDDRLSVRHIFASTPRNKQRERDYDDSCSATMLHSFYKSNYSGTRWQILSSLDHNMLWS